LSRAIPYLALAAAFLATSCSSIHKESSFHEIASKPAISAIELVKPATVSEEGATTTFPAGKYRVMYEDDHGYYYEAPGKVLVDDVGVYGFDGGVYVERGKEAPTHWYIIRPNGRRSMGHFKTAPMYKKILTH
jgi:hypothetical protein